ncbi:hypothetical protein [Cloacibacillus porcorum]|uniref:hypothetical protein n=1 Tax=Cloacibacillus porcorum TaxID=1197717 RepID=UPI003D079373
METKHTPGPWKIHKAGHEENAPIEIIRPNEDGKSYRLIAKMYGFALEEGKANARLITAAPEMYEALKWACRNTDCKWHERECEDCPVGAALKKVEIDAS